MMKYANDISLFEATSDRGVKGNILVQINLGAYEIAMNGQALLWIYSIKDRSKNEGDGNTHIHYNREMYPFFDKSELVLDGLVTNGADKVPTTGVSEEELRNMRTRIFRDYVIATVGANID